MGANVAALVIVVMAVFLLIVGLRGTQADVFGGLFKNVKLPGQDSAPSTSNNTSNNTGGSNTTTQTYTFGQLRLIALQAGFSQAQSMTAAAIALAESAGNPSATGPFGERGLWQVYPAAHPDLAQQYNLYDPLQNAQAAHAVFSMQGWGAWTTYVTGAYRQFLGSTATV